MKAFALSCMCLLSYCAFLKAQDTVTLVGKFSDRYINKIEQKAEKVEAGLTTQSRKALERLQKQQNKVYQSLQQLDSNAAKAFLLNSQQQYAATLSKLNGIATAPSKAFNSYVPGLDSMSSVLGYLDKLPSTTNLPGKEKLTGALAAANKAGGSLDAATVVNKVMQQQKEQLKALATRYKNLDITKQLKAYNQEIYYYGQRVQQAKEMLNDPSKIEGEVLKLLRKNKAFQGWMQQNSQLARMFGAPGANNNPAIALAGLQTRQSVQQALQARLGGSLQQAQQQMSSAVQSAQGQLSNMRNQLQQMGSGSFGNGSSDMTMPDFKPNNQKTKSFLQRLEYGFNLQSQKSNRWLPSISDIGLSLGYKLNDKSVIGVGLAYKLGWGQPISHIRFSHQGIGLRSYFDYKLKGSFWVSSGYEQNYMHSFRNLQQTLGDISLWQRSALAGLSKKLKIKGKKELKTQLLYNFLHQSNQANPALQFRVGYNF